MPRPDVDVQIYSRVFTCEIDYTLTVSCFILYLFSRPATLRTLEQGYCLTDLYMMDRERGDTKLKFIHALQQFTKIAGRTIHLHQVIMQKPYVILI